MAIVASNGLTGPDGVQPTAGSLADTGTAPSFLDNSGMLYSDEVQIRGRNSTLLYTGITRASASRFAWTMPNDAWTMRFYLRTPPLSDPFDIAERRLLIEFGTEGMMFRESAARNVVSRLQSLTLAASNVVGTESGQARVFDQLLRYEIMFDGVGELTVRIFSGNDTTPWRQNVWEYIPDGNNITISGYRWYNYPVLQSGDTDASTGGEVTALQNQLLVWDPNSLPQFGADGDYGDETTTAVTNFQSAMGIAQTGTAGPETRTALALYVRLDNDPDDYPDPIWVGNMAITDTADWIGPLDPSSAEVELVTETSVDVEAEDTTTAAHIEVASEVLVGEASKSVNVDQDFEVEAEVQADISKSVGADVEISTEASVNVAHTAVSFIPDPPPLVPTFRLAIYNANFLSQDGSLRGYIYRPLHVQVSSVFNEVGGGTFSIPESSPEVQYITGDDQFGEIFEVAFEIQDAQGENYIEPPNMRFYAMRREFDEADRSGTITWTLVSCGAILRGIRPSGVGSINGVWAARFTNVREVNVILGYLNQYVAEFSSTNAVSFDWNFTTSVDSDGTSWTGPTFDIEYPINAMLDNTLDTFAVQRALDWRFNGRELQVFMPDTVMNQNLSDVGPSGVYLRTGRDMLEAREILSYENMRTRINIYGGNFVSFGGDVGSPPYGAGHDIVVANGIYADTTVVPPTPHPLVARIRAGRVPEIAPPMRGIYRRFLCRRMDQVPLRDYNPGDRVRVQSRTPGRGYAQDDFDTRRIREIVLTAGANRVLECTMTLETRFLPKDIQLQREQHQMSGGSANRGAGTWNRTFGP